MCENALNLTTGKLIVDNNWPFGTFCKWMLSAQDDNSYVSLEFQNLNVRNCNLDRHHAWRSLDPTLDISSHFVKKEHFDCFFIFRSFFPFTSSVALVAMSQGFPKVPKGSQRFPKIPKDSQRFPKVPQGSPRFPKVPQGSPRFSKVL